MSENTTVSYMSKEDILDAIHTLSYSQGFYQRIYDAILTLEETDPDLYDTYMEYLQQQHFKDPVDLVMFFEC